MNIPNQPDLAIREVELTSGHRLDIETTDAGSLLRLSAADGRVSLTITVTPEGPVISLGGYGATLNIQGPLGIQADQIKLHGRKDVAISSGGNLSVEAAGDIRTIGRSQEIIADLGDVRVKANDDVRLNGERVRCNC